MVVPCCLDTSSWAGAVSSSQKFGSIWFHRRTIWAFPVGAQQSVSTGLPGRSVPGTGSVVDSSCVHLVRGERRTRVGLLDPLHTTVPDRVRGTCRGVRGQGYPGGRLVGGIRSRRPCRRPTGRLARVCRCRRRSDAVRSGAIGGSRSSAAATRSAERLRRPPAVDRHRH